MLSENKNLKVSFINNLNKNNDESNNIEINQNIKKLIKVLRNY